MQGTIIATLYEIHFFTEVCKLPGSQEGEGECLIADSCAVTGVKEDLRDFVGSFTVDTLSTSCKCSENQYGPFCKSKPQESDLGLCGKGRYKKENYLTGCECRDEDGNVVPFHGWYCEFHNKLLCKENYPFYDVTKMDDVVGNKVIQSACNKCDKILENCAECLQDETTNCNFFSNDHQKQYFKGTLHVKNVKKIFKQLIISVAMTVILVMGMDVIQKQRNVG